MQNSLLQQRSHPGKPLFCGISLAAAETEDWAEVQERPHRREHPRSSGFVGLTQTTSPRLQLSYRLPDRTSDSQQSNGPGSDGSEERFSYVDVDRETPSTLSVLCSSNSLRLLPLCFLLYCRALMV